MMIDGTRQAALLAQMRDMAEAARSQESRSVANDIGPTNAPQAQFATLFQNMVAETNNAQQTGAQLSRDFVAGAKDVDVAEVMVAMQKARVHFETMVQVRNRLVPAYEEIMRMPV